HLQKSGKIGECRQVLKDALERGSKAGIEAQMARAHAGQADIAFDEGNIREAYDEMIQAFTLASNFEYASDWTSKVVECAEIEPVPAELLALIERLAASWKGDSRRLADIH